MGPVKVGKQIKTVILRENYKFDDHGIETINMQFKFKLFFTFVSNSIINMYFIFSLYVLQRNYNVLQRKEHEKM